MWRIPLGIGVVLAPFLFPWPFVLILAGCVTFFIPPIAFVAGALLDILYFSGSGIPYFTLIGLGMALVAFFVHQFVKTRIM